MPGLYYLGRPWADNPEPPDDGVWDDDELPTHCQECGVELKEGEEVLCATCLDQLNSEPFQQPDSATDDHDRRYMDYYDTMNGDSGENDPPF